MHGLAVGRDAGERGAHRALERSGELIVPEHLAIGAEHEGGREAEHLVLPGQLAGVHEMILQLPNAYETEIGEAGAALSGHGELHDGLAAALADDLPLLARAGGFVTAGHDAARGTPLLALGRKRQSEEHHVLNDVERTAVAAAAFVPEAEVGEGDGYAAKRRLKAEQQAVQGTLLEEPV